MSSSDERISSPEKTASLSSPPDIYISSDKDDESSTLLREDDDADQVENKNNQENIRDTNVLPSADGNLENKPDDEYFRPIKKLRMVNIQQNIIPSPSKPLTSFLIKDILSHKSNVTRRHSTSSDRGIVRPWDLGSPANLTTASRRPRSADDDSRSDKSESDSSASPSGVVHNASPLDALFEMTSKAFEGLDADEKSTGKCLTTLLYLFLMSSANVDR